MRQANRLSIEAVLKIGCHAAGCFKRDVTTLSTASGGHKARPYENICYKYKLLKNNKACKDMVYPRPVR